MRTLFLCGVVLLTACGPDGVVTVEATDDAAGEVASELSYRQLPSPGRSIHLAEVDLCEAGIELRATAPGEGVMTVKQFSDRVGALLAINGGHSWSYVPSVSAHAGRFFGNPDQGDIGQAAFGPGLAEFIHMSASYSPQPGHQEVVSGLLTLVHDGVAQQASLPHDAYTCSVQHPRTLLGLTADKRKLLMVVVDGRAPSAGRLGMTCREAADFMVSLGAHWALNLDGGGSTEMVVGGRIVNVPSDGQERPVPTHLAVIRTPGARGHCPTAPVQPPPQPPSTPAACGAFPASGSLLPGDEVRSCNGRFVFVHQGDGNVVLYDGNKALWNTRTSDKATRQFAMQGDGNLVLYATSGVALWNSRTQGHAGARFTMQDDGNAVVRSTAGAVLWATNTVVATPPPAPTPTPAPPTPAPTPSPSPTSTCGSLGVNDSLARGESVSSCDGRFTLVHQGDGNVVLYQSGVARWSTRTQGKSTGVLVMQGDGNLVLYSPGFVPVWNTRTAGHAGATLAVQNDGNLVIYEGSRVLWSLR